MTVQTLNANNESEGTTSEASGNPAQIGSQDPRLETPVAIESEDLLKLRAISVSDQEERVESVPGPTAISPKRRSLLEMILAPMEMIDGWLGGPVLTPDQRAEATRSYAKSNFHKLGG